MKVFLTFALCLMPLLSPAAEPAAPPPSITSADVALPTANDALFREGHEEEFFQATAAGDWQSGQYGCYRSEGHQFHEGIDIRCLERDRHGEPLDAVNACAAGTLAYINHYPGKSNYGRYAVVQHNFGGVEVYSLYAHLSETTEGLVIGAPVQKGQRIATMGHTGVGLTRERSHVHFELNFFVNPNFEAWYRKHYPKEPNDHGVFNGQNLVGFDPAALLLAARKNPALTIPEFVRQRPEAFRVLLPLTHFRWLERNAWSLVPNAPTVKPSDATPAAYEVSFDGTGIPREVLTRSAAELTEEQKDALTRNHPLLLSANDTELVHYNCRHLVNKSKRGAWQLSEKGLEWLEMFTY